MSSRNEEEGGNGVFPVALRLASISDAFVLRRLRLTVVAVKRDVALTWGRGTVYERSPASMS